MTELHFTAENCKGNDITIKMPHSFYIENIRHKLEHGQRCIQEVKLISPTGGSKSFMIVGESGGGIRYRNEKINLNLVKCV